MASNVDVKLKKVESILVSQPEAPKRSPYYEIAEKYNIKVDFRPFIKVEGLLLKDFRKQKINIESFKNVILTSKNSVDHFFRLCEEARIKPSQETKYFCLTETVALYLQKFILFRKRKVFHGNRHISELKNALTKHKKDKYLLPLSNLGKKDVVDYLKELGLDFQEAIMYQTVSSDLSDLKDITYDMLVFFSPQGIESLFENFPDFKQNETRIAVFGESTARSAEKHLLNIDIKAPMPEAPSMTMAIELYLQSSNG